MSDRGWCTITEYDPETGVETVTQHKLISVAEFLRKWRARERMHTLIHRAACRADSTAYLAFQTERSCP